jgi:hypothetical protein
MYERGGREQPYTTIVQSGEASRSELRAPTQVVPVLVPSLRLPQINRVRAAERA